MEWRWLKKEGNSGVLLHVQEPHRVWPNCIECQLQSGNAGDLVLIGPGSIRVNNENCTNEGSYLIIPKLHESSEKSIGEWNSYKIICKGSEISCYVNGVLQNTGNHASLSTGKIAIQSESAPVEFKNIYLKILSGQ